MHAYCHTHSIFDNNYDNAEEKGERERKTTRKKERRKPTEVLYYNQKIDRKKVEDERDDR